MTGARVILIVLATCPASGCFEVDDWKPFASIRQLDYFTEVHIAQVLKNLRIPHRFVGGLKNNSIEVRTGDYSRVMLALLPDQEAGNIDFLPGYARKSQVETIRRPFAEFAKDPRIAGDPLLKAVFQEADVVQRAKSYRYVESIEIRRRVGLGPDNRPRRRVEGRIELVLELEKEVGGLQLWYGINSDDMSVETEYPGKWWKGDPLAIRREYGLLE